MKEHMSMNMLTKLQAAIFKKTTDFYRLNAKEGYFLRYSRGFGDFSDFQIVSDFMRSKSAVGPFFALLTKI